MSDYKIDYCHHDSVTAESRQDYIKKNEATTIPVLPKEHRKQFKSYDDAFETGWNEALSCVNLMPSVDVVKVTRCKDCKWRGIVGCCALDIVVEDDKPNDDDYCSYGERKEK